MMPPGLGSPELSVVVPSVNSLDDLVGCLEALEAQRTDIRLEVLVADRLGEAVRQEVRRRFPNARVIAAPAESTIPQLRAMAIAAATGDLVAVIEDHVIVPPGWGRRLAQAIAEGADVVGGSVENAARDALIDWAAFLCEYSAALPPLPEGPTESLVGNNVVYRRALLERHRATLEEGRWENHLHAALRRDGIQLVCRPEITVGHKMHYTFWLYFTQRYFYARSYAGMRVEGRPFTARLVYGCAAFLLPPLLLARTVSTILSKGGHTSLLLRCLPLIAVFVLSWGAGEVVGYWFGAGDSLRKVR